MITLFEEVVCILHKLDVFSSEQYRLPFLRGFMDFGILKNQIIYKHCLIVLQYIKYFEFGI